MIDIDERAERAGEAARSQARAMVARMPHPADLPGSGPRRRLLAVAGGMAVAAAAVTMMLSGGASVPLIDANPDPAAPVAVDGVLPVPDPGGVLAAYLEDGTPVFVTRPTDGEVYVLDAASPHPGSGPSGELVAYCPSSGGFEDLYHGSKFTAYGDWMGGPAPAGLRAYPTEAATDGSTVEVTGPAGEAPDREDRRGERYEPRGASCAPDETGSSDIVVAHRPNHPVAAVSGSAIPMERWIWAILVLGGEPDRVVACDTDGMCPPDAPTIAADVNQPDGTLVDGSPAVHLARARPDGTVELLRPAHPDDHRSEMSDAPTTGDANEGVRLSDDEVVVLAAAATDDASLKGHVVADSDGLASVWRMGTLSGTPPTVPEGHIAVLVFARQTQSTCRSVDDVLGVEIRDGLAVVVLDPDGEFLRPCPGPQGAAAWTAFAIAIPDRYLDALTGADARLADATGREPPAEKRAWVDDDAKEAWDAEHGPGTWIVAYFFPPDFAYDSFDDGQLVRRWRLIAADERDLDRVDLLTESLAALPDATPEEADNSWLPYTGGPERSLELASVRLDGDEIALDFSELEASAPGSTAGVAMGLQFDTIVTHYYPQAASICVLVNGETSEWLHDTMTCPSRQ